MVHAFQEIIGQLEGDATVSEGVARFINPPADDTPAADDTLAADAGVDVDGGAPAALDGELYFPLPANDAQRQIVRRLNANRGVLVQGPPGTGKSHTIVNLISHALATGQRVLVTSHAPRALRVLREMIRDRAPEIAPLAVVLPGDGRDALREMEASVQGILDRQTSWSPPESDAAIERLGKDLDQARRNEARVSRELRAIREQETYTHDDRYGYSGTLARIAETLNGERNTLGWIPDEIPHDAEAPLLDAQFDELARLLRRADVTLWEEGGWTCVNIEDAPTAETFEQAVGDESEARVRSDDVAHIRKRSGYAALKELAEDHRRNLTSGLTELARILERIERHPLPWTDGAAAEIVGGADQAWRRLHEDTLAAAESMAGEAEWLDAHPISPDPPDPATLRADAADLLAHLEAGGGWGFWVFRAGVVKRTLHIRELRVGGRRCETAGAVRDLLRRLGGEIERARLRERWLRHHEFASTTFAALAAELRDVCAPVRDALEALTVRQRLAWIMTFASEAPEPVWTDRAALLRLLETLDAIAVAERYEEAHERIEAWLRDLTAQRRLGIDPALAELVGAVMERDPAAYQAARRHALDNLELAARLSRRQALLGNLEGVAPKLAADLAETSGDAVWDERAADFERAWNWRRTHAWVTRVASPDEERRLRLELDRATQEIAGALERLAAEQAWNYCLSRMTASHKGSLSAWRQAVRRIGRGKGKYAAQHLRDARRHLSESRSAIPAWVMPLHRVAETMAAGPRAALRHRDHRRGQPVPGRKRCCWRGWRGGSWSSATTNRSAQPMRAFGWRTSTGCASSTSRTSRSPMRSARGAAASSNWPRSSPGNASGCASTSAPCRRSSSSQTSCRTRASR